MQSLPSPVTPPSPLTATHEAIFSSYVTSCIRSIEHAIALRANNTRNALGENVPSIHD